jgi:hypothetical protein
MSIILVFNACTGIQQLKIMFDILKPKSIFKKLGQHFKNTCSTFFKNVELVLSECWILTSKKYEQYIHDACVFVELILYNYIDETTKNH